ncbi:MAG: P1 family peptidase [bacterium]|nr:P1 family peptidase [bacterium]
MSRDSIAPLPELSPRLAVEGFSIGHGTDTDGMTGVTVILCPEGVVAAAEVRGTATSTRQFDALTRANHVGSRAHALVLAGGSAFGLSAADEVGRWLARHGHGLATDVGPVPSVPTAILFDLGFGDPEARPTPELVRSAVENAASGDIACGSVGAGTGATVGKALGRSQAMKGGFGFAGCTTSGGISVAAAVAVNAFGDVRDAESGTILAGCRATPESHELVGADRVFASLTPEDGTRWQGNTTLAVVLTDAILDKVSARKVTEMAFGGLYRTLVPALTIFDGDLLVTLASARKPAHTHQIGVLAERAVAHAVVTAVRQADGFSILPAARDLR